MTSNVNKISRQFNQSAVGYYDVHAIVQRQMAQQLFRVLMAWMEKKEALRTNHHLLEIGCGTGILSEMLLAVGCSDGQPYASFTALDIASAMVKLACQRSLSLANQCRQAQHIRFMQADVETWALTATQSFSLIVSNACFQWLHKPKQTIEALKKRLHPEGLLIFTTFGAHTFWELHHSFTEVYQAYGLQPQRHGLSLRTAEEWTNILKQAGFSILQCEQVEQVETYPSVRAFLHAIKAIGASTSEANVPSSLGLKRLFTDMYNVYETKFSTQQGVFATYDLLLICATVRN